MSVTQLYATSHITGTVATPANALGAPDATWTTTTGNTSWDSRFALDNLAAGQFLTGTQTITVRARKEAGKSGTPTLAAELWENGSLVASLFGATNVTSDTSQDIQGTFAATAITNPNNVEVRLVCTAAGGAPSARTSVQIDSINWTATHEAVLESEDFVPLSIPSGAVNSDLENFPVFVDLANLSGVFWGGVQADGGDIRVTLDDGATRLPVEVVSIDTGAETGAMFFLAPEVLAAGSDFRVYYGGPGGLTQPAVDAAYGRNAVWADYALVWHLAQDPNGTAPQMVDSTGKGNDGTAGGAGADSAITDSPWGYGLDHQTTNRILKTSPTGLPNSPLTFQFANKFDAVGQAFNGVWGIGTEGGSAAQVCFQVQMYHTTNIARLTTSNGTTLFHADLGGAFSAADTWYRWHFTHDGSLVKKYRNGGQIDSDTATNAATASTRSAFVNASGTGGTYGSNGQTAEFRVRAGALSADWIAAEEANVQQNAAFLTLGESDPNLYVATTGSDTTGDGTVGNPYATINKASAEAGPGYTIHVAAGTYIGQVTTSTSGTSGSRLRYLSTTLWGAKIDANDASDRAWVNSGNYVDIEGFEITNAVYVGILNNGHTCRVEFNHIHSLTAPDTNNSNGGAFYTENAATSHDNVVNGNWCHGNQPPETTHNHGIYIASAGAVVTNNVVYDVAARGIQLFHLPQNVIVANNLVFDCNMGILLNHESGEVDNCLIINNIVRDCSIGIREEINAGTNNDYINNLIYNCTTPLSLSVNTATGTITSNPQHVNYQIDGSGDYHLTSISPARGAGTITGAPATDYDGVTRGSPPDIGPFEYVAVAPSIVMGSFPR